MQDLTFYSIRVSIWVGLGLVLGLVLGLLLRLGLLSPFHLYLKYRVKVQVGLVFGARFFGVWPHTFVNEIFPKVRSCTLLKMLNTM